MSDDNSTHVNDARIFDSSPTKRPCQACGNYTENAPALCDDCLEEQKAYQSQYMAKPPVTPNTNVMHTEEGPISLNCETTEPVSLSAKPEQTAQDHGEPSPVPYSIFIKSPAVDTEETGIARLSLSLALSCLDEYCVKDAVPRMALPFVEMARKSFNNGYYRFELIVGDLSIRIYKHPNNP